MAKRYRVVVAFEVEVDTKEEAQTEVETLCELMTEDAGDPPVLFAGVLEVCEDAGG